MSDLELVLLILAGVTGVFQFALLATLVLRGGRVSIWWGVACTAFLIAYVVVT